MEANTSSLDSGSFEVADCLPSLGFAAITLRLATPLVKVLLATEAAASFLVSISKIEVNKKIDTIQCTAEGYGGGL